MIEPGTASDRATARERLDASFLAASEAPSAMAAGQADAWRLAHVNIARLRAVRLRGAERRRGALAPLNALAKASRGFVWRLPGHTRRSWRDQLILANVSVWESYEALHEFTYRTAHGRFVRKRTSWFERMDGHTTALWWVCEGTRPSMGAAPVRLKLLNTYGPSPRAFRSSTSSTPRAVAYAAGTASDSSA